MEEDEFSGLVLRMRFIVHAFAARRLAFEQAEEVVSETFEVVWRKRGQAPRDPLSWPAWVIGIAKNKVLQEAQLATRKHHDHRFLSDWEGSYREHATEAVMGVVIESLMARLMLSQLTVAERELLHLAHLRNPPLNVEQMAQALGISVTAVTSRVNRLRRRIADLQTDQALPATSSGSITSGLREGPRRASCEPDAS